MKNDLFDTLANILDPGTVKSSIPTSEGPMTISEIFDRLNYSSYCVQRDAGSTHKELSKYPCWDNEQFKIKYYNDNQIKRTGA